ncbi:MAG: subtilisin family serine protease [Halioglobus sp.]|jgi:subtilisin family serine protease
MVFVSMFTSESLVKWPTIIKSRVLRAVQRYAACAVFGSLLIVAPPIYAALSFGGLPEDTIEDTIEDSVEESVAEQVEDQIIEQVEERALTFGGASAAYIESLVEEAVEEEVVDNIEESVEESVAEEVEASVEEQVADNIEETIVENVEEAIVDSVEDIVAESVEESVAANVEENIEQQVAQEVEQEVELTVSSTIESAIEVGVEGSVEREIDQLIQSIEGEIEVDEDRIQRNEWLVMAEAEVFDELAKEGYLFDKVTDLPGIGMRLAEVAAPSSFDITVARQGVIDVVGMGRAKVDLNHIYTAGAIATDTGAGVSPRGAIELPSDIDDLQLKIGMVDSHVDTSHTSLGGSQIHQKSFVSKGSEQPDSHGTAIASMLAANSSEYTGLAPSAIVFAASVFEKNEERGEFASTVSLVLALDWLVSSGVDVINISLAGPPNTLLELALHQAEKRDVLIIAAAGNGGPLAKPLYPAAYDSVIAVTAVDTKGQVFRLANRGSYLDLAAPGVGMRHALAGGGYASSSGTSFAVPFVVTAAARLRSLQPSVNARELLNVAAKDLGPVGRDEIYGYGLLSLKQI